MEFWGVEVKAGQPLKVSPGEEKLIHLSQASLGESKNKGNESTPIFVKFGDQKLVLGTLSQEKFPQLSFDLVFEKEFELSHNWKNGSVYFAGYKAAATYEEDEPATDSDMDSFDEEDEELPLNIAENGKAGPKVAAVKSIAAPSEKQVKISEPSKDVEDDDSSGSSDEDDDDDDISGDEDEDMSFGSAEDDDESDDEPEETPKKVESSKKRPSESATKTPVPAKKAKAATPQKTDGKKVGGHTATPHPSKKAAKTPATSEQSKQKSPKSGGAFSCQTCSRTFGSEVGLQSHTKAKHGEN
ncbi:histone deacetylase HDT1-like [Quercus lobata]|nr:histone deacetylase HDT1-like [Quercus lobata]